MKTVIEVFPQLKELSVVHRQILAGLFFRRQVNKFETLLSEDEIETRVVFIEAGVFRHARIAGKTDSCIGLFRPGQIVSNYYSWLYGSASLFQVESLTPAYVWELTDESYHRLSQDLQRELRRLLAEQICTQSHRNYIEMARSQYTMESYEYMLGHEPYILMHTPVMHLAAFLGVTQHTLSRIRRQVMQKEKGLIIQ